ncbi:hypothetical protein ACWT_2835 [Actinoplanes sp. SE50]|nr:hypothetical protein ACPL_2711 [Actinoplanes sp. SE50/110]ATO82250.1 hypothetical protein ACWT_2835 [Actinoplanes sp. SE50]SLL99657.1 hypothetical protein ACSP50_2888 [Actinoplanes sp. SE50/110]
MAAGAWRHELVTRSPETTTRLYRESTGEPVAFTEDSERVFPLTAITGAALAGSADDRCPRRKSAWAAVVSDSGQRFRLRSRSAAMSSA